MTEPCYWFASTIARQLLDQDWTTTRLSTDECAIFGLVVDLATVTATDLYRWTGLARTTLSTLLRRREEWGSLARSPNPDDARSAYLALTPAGVQAYRAAQPALVAVLAEVGRHLAVVQPSVRTSLGALDSSLRVAAGMDPRPYPAPADPTGTHLDISGPPLTTEQQSEVRAYVAWVRHRDATTSDGSARQRRRYGDR